MGSSHSALLVMSGVETSLALMLTQAKAGKCTVLIGSEQVTIVSGQIAYNRGGI